MLTLEMLIKYLNIKQERLSKLYGNKTNNMMNITQLPDAFVDISADFKKFYYIDERNKLNKNNLLYTILYCIDENFISNLEKEKYTIELRKKMCYDLERLFREFNYVSTRKFKKDKIQETLMNFNKNISLDCDDSIKQYIADYFGINIYIFSLSENNEKDIFVYTQLSKNDNDIQNPYKPTILLFIKNNIFYPIFENETSIFNYSKYPILKLLFEKYVSIHIKKIKKTQNDTEHDIDDTDFESNDIETNDIESNNIETNDNSDNSNTVSINNVNCAESKTIEKKEESKVELKEDSK